MNNANTCSQPSPRLYQLCDRHGRCTNPAALDDPSPSHGLRFLADMRAQGFDLERAGDVVLTIETAQVQPLPKKVRPHLPLPPATNQAGA